MTAIAQPAGRRPTQPGPGWARWRRLAWVTWRQHRSALAAVLGFFALAAVAMALIPVNAGGNWFPGGFPDQTLTRVVLMLQLLPVLTALFLGVPVVAREAESGTLPLAWTQGTGRARWLLVQAVPLAVLPALAAAGLGAELSWWLGPAGWRARAWDPSQLSLNPLPYAGWVVLAFSIGLVLGAAIRRTVPAIAATIACYGVVLLVVEGWKSRLLVNLHLYEVPATHGVTARYLAFQSVEFGGLIAASVLLTAVTVLVIRRRDA
jgi:hypothetical protein